MRKGFGRLAQKFRSKHSQLLHHASPTIRRQCFVRPSRCLFGQYSHSSCRAFTNTSKRLDEAENELGQQDKTIPIILPDTPHRSKPKVQVGRGLEAMEGLRSGTLKGRKTNPETCSLRLNEIYLQAGASSPYQHLSGSHFPEGDTHLHILDIMYGADNPHGAGVDMFTYMGIKQGRWKAVLWLADTLLQNVSMRMLNPRDTESPSNIVWGSEGISLENLTQQPFSVETTAHASSKSIEASTTLKLDPKYSDLAADNKDRVLRTMQQIWRSLGSLIIEAAELPDDQSEIVMAVVYQIIAKVHALGLVPDNVYSYATSGYSSMSSRPPILHLLSSRVLTTLSDATWRSHQMDVIEQAVSLGTPLQSLVKDLPGGRFRLKVRPLGPEIWLEFVLWCCVEGGFGSAGVYLVNRLQKKVQNPWFAMPWTSQTGNELSSTVDWDRVRSRHGGSVGLIEGYNRERPFVEMAPRTVSAEVVLMLVETMANSVNTGVSGRSMSINTVLWRAIPRLIEFLEPHGLPVEYFDYIAVRLLQTGAFDVEQDPEVLERWAEKVSDLRLLESTLKTTPGIATFGVPSIIEQSEVYAGMLHQAMEAYVEKFDVRAAIAVFNRIQELVDVSKVQSISAFLATTSVEGADLTSQEILSPHARTGNLDFVRSHGQLPLHKIASFLNLTTDSKLFRIGQWLLSPDEVDEPVIPKRLFDRPALTTALVRYAGLSGDEELVAEVIRARGRSSLLPSVSLLRSLVDALVLNYNFREAHSILMRLTKAKGGGGCSPTNLASSAVTILALESRTKGPDNIAVDPRLSEAWQMIGRMMDGYYDGRTDTFRIDISAIYCQQLAALLMVLSSVLNPRISSFARRWQNKYPLSNSTVLATDTFNIILAGVVDTEGSSNGMRLWQLFCDDLSLGSRTFGDVDLDDSLVKEYILGDDDDNPRSRRLQSVLDRFATRGDYVPFVEFPTTSPLAVPAEGGEKTDESEENLRSGHFEFANAFPLVSDNVEDANPEQAFLVRPDLRTLRIIVQGALAERRVCEDEGMDTFTQRQVLQWATQFYRQFGTSTEIIQQEIQLPVEEPVSDVEEQRTRDERKMRIAVAAAGARERAVGHVYQQFHRWRPVLGA